MVSGMGNYHSLVLTCTDLPSAAVLMNTNQHSVSTSGLHPWATTIYYLYE